MGCAVYPQEQIFYEKLQDEAIQVIKRLRDPLITLLSGSEISGNPELAYSILSHIYFLILKGGRVVFSEIYKRFFVKFEEPLYVPVLIDENGEQLLPGEKISSKEKLTGNLVDFIYPCPA